MSATITHPISPPTPERPSQDFRQGQILPPSVPAPAESAHTVKQIGLSGSNLQNRLNHLVPPPPINLQQQRPAPFVLPNMQAGQSAAPPAPSSQNRSAELFSLAPPTADQMANLNRRLSQDNMRGGRGQRPLSIATSGAYQRQNHDRNGHCSAAQDFALVPPSPPRAAWGAAGVSGSLSFNKAQAQVWNVNGKANPDLYQYSQNPSSQGPARAPSRGGQRSTSATVGISWGIRAEAGTGQLGSQGPHSHSTPNLLAQRPKYGRLDTIESIASTNTYHGADEHGYAHARAHSVVNPNPGLVNGELTISGQQASVAMAMYNSHLNGGQEQRPGIEPRGDSWRKKKKKKKDRGERGDFDGFQDGDVRGKKDKGSKCVVM